MNPIKNPTRFRSARHPLATVLACLGLAFAAAGGLAKPPPDAPDRPEPKQPKDVKDGKGDKGPKDAEPGGARAADRRVTVAVLDFESGTPGNPDLGRQIGEVLMATLSGEDGFRLVDRAAMGRVLQENELNLSGLVGPDQATKIGKLVGARILVTGKAFAIDNQVFMTAKLIGTETSLVEGIIVKGQKGADNADLIMQLSQKVSERLRTAGPKLLADDEAMTDPLPALRARLAGRKLPKVSVSISERHLSQVPVGHIDPAVDTEVKNVLIAAGFTVIDGTEGEQDRAGVEVTITGEAFSEFNARIANLVSCSGRVELKASNRKEGTILFSGRTTTRAVDLAENTAGKTALQKGGRELALALLQHFADTLPPAEKGPGEKGPAEKGAAGKGDGKGADKPARKAAGKGERSEKGGKGDE